MSSRNKKGANSNKQGHFTGIFEMCVCMRVWGCATHNYKIHFAQNEDYTKFYFKCG